MGAVLFHLDRERLAGPIAAARAAVGAARFEDAWASGRALPFEQVVDDAIAEAHRSGTGSLAAGGSPVAQGSPVASPPLFRVRTLGAFVVVRDGGQLQDALWAYARPRELFAYLLVHPEGRSRDQIALSFWPDASAAQAKNNFHVTLHHLRRALGRGDVVVFEHERYRANWALGIDVDVATFDRETAAARAELRANPSEETARRLREALDLYRGEFLAGESAGDWHLEVRDRVGRVWADGMSALGAYLLASGAAQDAEAVYRRLVAADELDEDAHRQLMIALAKSGQRGEALRHYDRLAKRLSAKLGVAPDSRTTALRDRLR